MPFEIINERPVIFIHIPKTAGVAVKKYFNFQESRHRTAQYFLSSINEGVVPISINTPPETPEYQKINNIIHKMNANGKHPFKEAFKFSFVRNPWDRVASLYHWHKESLLPEIQVWGTFNDLISEIKNKKGSIFDVSSTSVLRLTQTQYLSIGNACDKVARPTLAMNYIGRVETIKEDINEIRKILYKGAPNQEFEESKYRCNVSSNSKQRYTQMYKDLDSIYAVFDYYYDDVVNFDYTFSGTPNCEITKECFKIKAQENVT